MTGALLWMWLCAFLNRWRGSGAAPHNPAGWSSTVQRIVLAVVLAAPAIVASPYHGLAIAILLVWPAQAMGWGQYFDFTDKPNTEPEVDWIDRMTRNAQGVRRDYLAMSLRGLHYTVPTAIVAALVNPLALILAPLGLLMGPAYYLPKKLGGNYIQSAELVWGAIIGAIMFDMGVLMYLA